MAIPIILIGYVLRMLMLVLLHAVAWTFVQPVRLVLSMPEIVKGQSRAAEKFRKVLTGILILFVVIAAISKTMNMLANDSEAVNGNIQKTHQDDADKLMGRDDIGVQTVLDQDEAKTESLLSQIVDWAFTDHSESKHYSTWPSPSTLLFIFYALHSAPPLPFCLFLHSRDAFYLHN